MQYLRPVRITALNCLPAQFPPLVLQIGTWNRGTRGTVRHLRGVFSQIQVVLLRMPRELSESWIWSDKNRGSIGEILR